MFPIIASPVTGYGHRRSTCCPSGDGRCKEKACVQKKKQDGSCFLADRLRKKMLIFPILVSFLRFAHGNGCMQSYARFHPRTTQ